MQVIMKPGHFKYRKNDHRNRAYCILE